MKQKDLSIFSSGPLQQIGFGNCGSVWGTLRSHDATNLLTPIVLKREDASPGRDIKNEHFVQLQVCAIPLSRVSVPRCLGFMDSQDDRWERLLPSFPDGYTECRAMISEKIEPVSIKAQKLLVERYGPGETQGDVDKFLPNGVGQHCLVRIYLGRRRMRPVRPSRGPRFFSLRNYPLHADQVEELGLPGDIYARAMAEALATLHWRLRTDAADVEFVLGAHRGDKADDSSSMPLGQHALWLLDFDCCRPITADEAALDPIARAFWRNDPYFPQPGGTCQQDRELWEIFANEYRRVGTDIVRNHARQGEDVEVLGSLVHGAIASIEATKVKWRSAGHC
ncbi:hypothetical protein HJFPF1_00162 [Paramyrothecium foliicola]|nr:hypothetical protein HJFPF1_00162 [Paramyrothecium foliicola]